MFMVAASSKLLGQVIFIAAGLGAIAMKEHDIGLMLISAAIGSLVPLAERTVREETSHALAKEKVEE